MKYMGGKQRLAKHILPIILKDRKPDQYYVEPFVGGCNVIDKVKGPRIGADLNEYVISLFKALQTGWTPPEEITKEFYTQVKNNKEDYPKHLVGYVGHALSYCGKWFGGFTSTDMCKKTRKTRNYMKESFNSVTRQIEGIKGIEFKHCSYESLEIPPNSIIYCDPPYKNTTAYKAVVEFDHDKFWQWVREKTKEGHQVFVSEYVAPNDFECVWQKDHFSALAINGKSKTSLEKLFIYKGE